MNYSTLAILGLLAVGCVEGCGGTPFTVGDIAQPDTSSPVLDTGVAEPTVDAGAPPTATDDGGVLTEIDSGDSGPATATTDSGAPEACVPDAPFQFSCLTTAATGPAQYCMLHEVTDIIETSEGTATPSACLCDFTCTCLIASGVDLCPEGSQFVNCEVAPVLGAGPGASITRYGVAVLCSSRDN
jgi:hypothetical protein